MSLWQIFSELLKVIHHLLVSGKIAKNMQTIGMVTLHMSLRKALILWWFYFFIWNFHLQSSIINDEQKCNMFLSGYAHNTNVSISVFTICMKYVNPRCALSLCNWIQVFKDFCIILKKTKSNTEVTGLPYKATLK